MKKKLDQTEIIFLPSNTPFSFKSVLPVDVIFKSRKTYRYYPDRREYKSILIKEALLCWLITAAIVWCILIVILDTPIWIFDVLFAIGGTVCIVPLVYFTKVQLCHVKPGKIYATIVSFFNVLTVDGNVTEVEPLCFIFKKDSYDFRLEYPFSPYVAWRPAYKLTVYFRYSLTDMGRQLADHFNMAMNGDWKIGDMYPFMAVSSLPPDASPALFRERVLNVLEKFRTMGYVPSVHIEKDN